MEFAIGTFETFFSARKSLLSWKVLLLIAIGTVMKEENFMAALAGVAERINRNEIDNLLEIDWNRITDGFRECCLKMLLGLIDTRMARVLAVRSFLAFYEAYLVECRYDYYLTCWDGKCQFKDFCMVLLRSFENYESFCLTGGRRDCRTGGSGKGADERCRPLPEQLESPYARELLARLQPAAFHVTVAFPRRV